MKKEKLLRQKKGFKEEFYVATLKEDNYGCNRFLRLRQVIQSHNSFKVTIENLGHD